MFWVPGQALFFDFISPLSPPPTAWHPTGTNFHQTFYLRAAGVGFLNPKKLFESEKSTLCVSSGITRPSGFPNGCIFPKICIKKYVFLYSLLSRLQKIPQVTAAVWLKKSNSKQTKINYRIQNLRHRSNFAPLPPKKNEQICVFLRNENIVPPRK